MTWATTENGEVAVVLFVVCCSAQLLVSFRAPASLLCTHAGNDADRSIITTASPLHPVPVAACAGSSIAVRSAC